MYLFFSSSVDNQFQKEPLFQGALKVAFETIMNTDVGTLTNAEYLATFCDRMLKKGGEKLSENQVEQRLENIVSDGGGGGGGGGRSTPELPQFRTNVRPSLPLLFFFFKSFSPHRYNCFLI